MDFHDQTVCSGRYRGVTHRCYVMVIAGSVRWIDDYGKMGFLFEHRDRGEVKGVACSSLKGADTAFAEDHRLIAFTHDIFGTHQELLNRHGHTPLEQHRLFQLSHLLQQGKIL